MVYRGLNPNELPIRQVLIYDDQREYCEDLSKKVLLEAASHMLEE